MNFEGDLSPGNSPAAINFAGDLTFGVGSTLEIELGGPSAGADYDQLNVAGDLTLDGALEVLLSGQFIPSAAQSFDVLEWGSTNGTFDEITLPPLSPSLSWNTSALYSAGVLRVGYAGDFDVDGDVDGGDFMVWQRGGSPSPNSAADLAAWKATFGSVAAVPSALPVPEPGALSLLLLAALSAVRNLRRSPR